ncbi:hypothetical protein BDV06DRAFT_225536 [Aspergillus oleicola]
MPTNLWTTEANAKFVVGILEQMKEQNARLSYQKLAGYMGPDFTRKSIDNQITKLKKQATQISSGTRAEDASAPSTPVGTPKRRRVGSKAGTPSKAGGSAKKAKVAETNGAEDDTKEE